MKVGFIIDRYPPRLHSSIGSFVQQMAQGLNRRGHQVTVFELGEQDQVRVDDSVVVRSVRRSNLRYVGNLVTRLRLLRQVRARVKAGDVDIVEAPDYAGLLAFGVSNCPVVIRLHLTSSAWQGQFGKKLSKGFYFYERRNLQVNRNWIGVSRHILNLTQSVFRVEPDRATVIYNPVLPIGGELPSVPGLPDQYVLSAGEVCSRKGSLLLAKAVGALMQKRESMHLVYVGSICEEDGRLLSDSILAAMGPTLAGRVHFLGRVKREQVGACMSRARVFSFPSRLEAMPLVVLEAMAYGAPVVCMRCPPGPELVQDGVTGLLADSTSAEDFGEKIARVWDNRDLAMTLAKNARAGAAERFSFQKCLDQTEQFYAECLGRTAEDKLTPHPTTGHSSRPHIERASSSF